MKTIAQLVAFSMLGVSVGCASMPKPVDRLTDAEATVKTADQMKAASVPSAALHYKLATEELDSARKQMADGSNEEADRMLQRAKSDAELSIALVNQDKADKEARHAQEMLTADLH